MTSIVFLSTKDADPLIIVILLRAKYSVRSLTCFSITSSAYLNTLGNENQRGSPISRNIGLVLKWIICFTACLNALEGIVPKWVQPPPTVGLSSTDRKSTRLNSSH